MGFVATWEQFRRGKVLGSELIDVVCNVNMAIFSCSVVLQDLMTFITKVEEDRLMASSKQVRCTTSYITSTRLLLVSAQQACAVISQQGKKTKALMVVLLFCVFLMKGAQRKSENSVYCLHLELQELARGGIMSNKGGVS